jgi:Family of unknown function (DUF6236)
VPLADILEFREKRKPELLQLQSAIDGFYSKVINSADSQFEFNQRAAEIRDGCVNAVKVAKEWHNPFKLSDWKISFSMKGDAIRDGVLGALIGQQFGMPEVGVVVGAAASSLNVSRDIGLKQPTSNNPYRYVSSFHKELFR